MKLSKHEQEMLDRQRNPADYFMRDILSGMSADEFCHKHGVSRTTYFNYKGMSDGSPAN